ncbi:hypothetical protein Godav_025194 [Gossypium davidsonii]|uniref:DUF4283 domain-containing protein n=1 Tax=Gossypium davidsonii TaxID=34287 RepID=A0A7J8TDJ0_GOSDV|nr:hypothetical protein [Gossypium davidsonii]
MSWIIFMGLPGYFYKRKILVEIGGLIGKVAKLDMNTNNRVKDRFARMVVNTELIFIRSKPSSLKPLPEDTNMVVNGAGEKSETYSPWMLVEKRSRRKLNDSTQSGIGFMNNRWKKGKDILPEGNLDSTTSHFSAALHSIGPSIRGLGNAFNSIPLADPTIVSHIPSEPGVGPVVPNNKPFNIPQSKVGAVKGPRNVDQVKKAIIGLGLVSTIELGVNSVRVFQGQIMKALGKTLSSSKTLGNQGWTEEGFFLGYLSVALHCMMIDKIISTPQSKPLS